MPTTPPTSSAAAPGSDARLRLLWFAPHFRTLAASGSLRTWALARHLAARGHAVTVLCPAFDPLTGQRLTAGRRLAAAETVDGVRLVRVWTTRNDRSRLWRRILFFLTQSVSALLVGLREPRPDLVVGANYPPTLAVAAWLVARLRRVPFVLEVRDLPAEAAIASGYVRNRALARIALALERFPIRRADRIVAVAPGMKRRMVELGVAGEAIAVVPNGYEETLFAAADFDRDVRAELGWGDRFVVLYAGTLGHVPDVPTLLAAARLCAPGDRMLFVLVGDGQREPEYREFCRRHGLDHCQFLGRRPRSEVPPLCRAADVCVNLMPKHPFWGSIFGNKNFDYLGSGTPYVYCGAEPSDTGDLLRACGGGVAVEAENPGALLAALRDLRDRPEERRRMGERGRRYVVEHYSRARIAGGFEALLIRVGTRDEQPGRS